MRKTFTSTLVDEAQRDNNIILVTADLGFMVLEDFAKKFPNRFINVGVAEGNMMGFSAGLALSGKTVFTYSIVTFITMRGYDHIRNDIAAQCANVKIVGVGGGFPYDVHGITHHGLEDIAIMRVLPDMTVICPADQMEAELAVRAIAKTKGPVYLRLGKGGEPQVHKSKPDFKIGQGIVVQKGSDATIIATGNIVHNAMKAAEILATGGISTRVISLHTVKPLDNDLIVDSAKKTKVVVTVEEHRLSGGLGSAVSQVILEAGLAGIKFKMLGVQDSHFKTGKQEYLRDFNSISIEKIASQVKKLL